MIRLIRHRQKHHSFPGRQPFMHNRHRQMRLATAIGPQQD
jgi:hypothetical protein